jgi:KinB signaling pathway activation protein
LTIRNWLRLFWSTLLIGSAAALVAGLILVGLVEDFTLMELSQPGFNWQTALFIILSGSTISVVSHVGFFSYLIVRDIFLGFLRSQKLWNALQIILVAVAFEMMTYIRWSLYGQPGDSWIAYAILPGILLIVALAAAYWKSLWTNRAGFIPSLFFIYVGTILEAVPAIQTNSMPSIVFMIVPLVASNTWQILMLPRYLKKQKEQA